MSAKRYRPETPSSLRSGSIRRHEIIGQHQYEHTTASQRSHGSEHGTPAPREQTPQRTGPLVLLHITLLACPSPPYSAQSMIELAPAYIVENWRLLKEKLTETVLDRGLLISHPGEEYDLLEERVLETLDLRAPRITACGHFYGGDAESDSGNDSGVSDVGRGSSGVRAICDRAHGEEGEEDFCHQCDQPMRLPGKGVGSGTRRWNVKIFAANGLMRAGAWAAAWPEMERVDVEIEPWMPEQVKRDLDARLDQEEEEERRHVEELEQLRFDLRETDGLRLEAEAARMRAEECAKEKEEELKRMYIAQTSRPAKVSAIPSLEIPDKGPTTPIPTLIQTKEPKLQSKDIPLSRLLYNYVYLLAQDRRNLALGFLSILVLFLSLNLASSKTAPSLTASPNIHLPTANISICSSTSDISPLSSPASLTQSPESSVSPIQPLSSDNHESSPLSASVDSPPAPNPTRVPHIPSSHPPEKDQHNEAKETSLKHQPHSQQPATSQASTTISSLSAAPLSSNTQ